jgi:hypothetical protein
VNTQPAQPVPADSLQPFPELGRQCHDRLDCFEEATVEIDATQLARVAELLALLDGFLRSGTGVADRLADYLHTTGRDRPQPQDGAGYDTNLVIDLVSFTAHALRVHGQGPPR